jgi:hypothetical protein
MWVLLDPVKAKSLGLGWLYAFQPLTGAWTLIR